LLVAVVTLVTHFWLELVFVFLVDVVVFTVVFLLFFFVVVVVFLYRFGPSSCCCKSCQKYLTFDTLLEKRGGGMLCIHS